jgi:EpsI family protein
LKQLAPWRYFVPAFLIIAGTATLLHARNSIETVPPHLNLSSFPGAIGDWRGSDIPIASDQLAVLGPGDYLMREYQQGKGLPLNLFLAYYPSQRSGDTIHSPQNCLPGSGWTPLKSRRIQIQQLARTPATVNRYIVANGSGQMLVLYWYQAHGRVTASEYWAKIFLVGDAIKLNRTDGALVRVAIPFDTPDDEKIAGDQALAFAAQISPLLDSFIPR